MNNNSFFPLSSQQDNIGRCISSLENLTNREDAEKILIKTFNDTPDNLVPNSGEYYSVLNFHLYQHILKHYKKNENRICKWRFIKHLSPDQLDYQNENDPELRMLDYLIRIYFYSDPLDDLTCLFIPVDDPELIRKYLSWIKSYFYEANYPTSLLWLYALDSSLSSLFPDEIIYLGQRTESEEGNIFIPDFNYEDTVLIKRFSEKPGHYFKLEGKDANNEFRQIFRFLRREYKDRCLSRSGKQSEYPDETTYRNEWEKFENVLKFGVSDKDESGCISFSDLRASTEFLNTYGKNIYLNKIQQPFFEQTKFISKKYNGRIDKFMGDNVMCVFLRNNMRFKTGEEKEEKAIINNFLALFDLCKILFELVSEEGLVHSRLGLRSGVTYGDQILRSNLGNEILRDFTVTGKTVNLAARLEHISIQELIIHNKNYFEKAIERFPQISELVDIGGNYENLNPETKTIMRDFTLYQNILSNLEKLKNVRFDIRFNQDFYFKFREYLREKGYNVLNPDTSEIYGYEEYEVKGFNLRFYFLHYNPKGFRKYEVIWILPLELEILKNLDMENIF